MSETTSAAHGFHHSRLLYLFLVCMAVALIAGCGSSPRKGGGGGYYKDDGPGDNIPENIRNIPDAVPRIEPHNRANFRSYTVMGQRFVPVSASTQLRQKGVASWYGRKFHGQKTANGETYDMYAMTAAHPTLPLPSYARVTHASSGRSVIVRVNDRGPFLRGRVIDLSYAAAAKLGIIGRGSDVVTVEAITHADIRRGVGVASNQQTPARNTAAAAPRSASVPSRAPAPTPVRVAAAAPAPAPASASVTTASVTTASITAAAPAGTSGASYAAAASGTSAAAAAASTSTRIGPSAPTPTSAPTASQALGGADGAAPTHVAMAPAPGTEVHAAAHMAGAPVTPDALAVLAAQTGDAPGASMATVTSERPATPMTSGARGTAMASTHAGATPAPTVTDEAAEGIYLQFGAFGSYISADRLVNRLNSEIAHVESRNAYVKSGDDLHRVRIGPYPTRTAAVNAAVRIQEATGMQPTLAQR